MRTPFLTGLANRPGPCFSALLIVGSLAPGLRAQTPVPVLQDGAIVGPIGAVEDVLGYAIDSDGRWAARVFDGTDYYLLEESTVVLQTGQNLPDPSQGTVVGWLAVALNDHDNTAVVASVDDGQVRRALLFNEKLLARQGDPVPVVAPLPVFYVSFQATDLSAKALAVVTSVTTNQPQTANDALLVFDVDAALGLQGVEAPVRPGDLLPGLTTRVANVIGNDVAINTQGDLLFTVRTLPAPLVTTAVYLNDRALMIEGEASVVGEPYANLSLASFDLNDTGSYLAVGRLESDDELLVLDDQPLLRSGDVLPDLAPRSLRQISRPFLSNGDDVFVEVLTDEPVNARNQAILRNGRVVFAEGDALLGGTVVGIRLEEVSASGRFMIVTATVDTVGRAVVIEDFGSAIRFSGCGGNRATLSSQGDPVLVGRSLTLEMDGGQAPGVLPFVAISTAAAPLSPCGPMTSFGELLIDLGPGNPVAIGAGLPWNGVPSEVLLGFPSDPSLVDGEFFAQGFFVDVAGSAPEKLRASNAMTLVVGAP